MLYKNRMTRGRDTRNCVCVWGGRRLNTLAMWWTRSLTLHLVCVAIKSLLWACKFPKRFFYRTIKQRPRAFEAHRGIYHNVTQGGVRLKSLRNRGAVGQSVLQHKMEWFGSLYFFVYVGGCVCVFFFSVTNKYDFQWKLNPLRALHSLLFRSPPYR